MKHVHDAAQWKETEKASQIKSRQICECGIVEPIKYLYND
jgi:hypothetical protein